MELETLIENYPQIQAGFFILIIWELIWKTIALWKSARAGHKGWYIAIMILNTVGIVPIAYLLTHRESSVSENIVMK